MTDYPFLVRTYLQELKDSGMTHHDIAKAMEFSNGNYISMLMSKENPTPLALDRIPAFQKLCKLDAYQTLELVFEQHKSKNSSKFFKWFVKLQHEAVKELKAKEKEEKVKSE